MSELGAAKYGASTMQCRLCQKDCTLRNSHIIPEFLYRPLYDEKHRALLVEPDSLDRPFVQKGLREKLLCDACEGHLGRWESYFAGRWFDPNILPDEVPLPNQVMTVSGLDYAKMKLFLLSVLWRASVSRRSEFRNASLGPHEVKIREMLLADHPGPADAYRVLAAVVVQRESRRVVYEMILPPVQKRVQDRVSYELVFGGVDWLFMISGHGTSELDGYCLTEHGDLPLLPVESDRIASVLALYQNRGKLR
ncbi:MAG: hypothetical protein MJE66_13590 [Proteobacteria bacterium]|nr:hypothetical protein [Pseudomonadota bacterium]